MDILKELKEKYKHNDCIKFKNTDNLRELCQAIPDGLCGIYFYTIQEEGKERILYIGCSGHIEDGKPVCRKKHGLRGRIYGKQKEFGNGEYTKRDKFYKKVMADKGVPELKIYWFNTKNDDPEYVEYKEILKYIARYGEFPEFNNKLERKKNLAIG